MKYLLLLFLFGCATRQSLHQTGTYTVKSVDGNVVSFHNVAGKYQLPVDTLKIGDTIRMNVIHLKR